MVHRWRTVLVAAIALAAGFWVSGAWSSGRLPVATALVVDRAFEERVDTVAPRETVSEVFARHGIAGADLLRLLAVADEIQPRRVPAGMVFTFRMPVPPDTTAAPTRADRVRVRVSPELFLVLSRDSAGWRADRERISWTVHTEIARGAIESSLYEAVEAAVPDAVLPAEQRSQLVWDLAEGVYQWQIDFTRDNYPGDGFTLVFERLVSSLGEVRYGRVLAAEVESRGRENLAYVVTDEHGRNAYYDERGRSLRRAFTMYPVRFRRISSGFSRRRLHPVLGIYRAHLGTDYAAAPGTPVETTGDGVVTRAGRWGGYGIIVTVRHAKGIETRYAHLRAVAGGVRPGVRVRQGQIIGYVGATGLARGPHVHYEFLKNGRHVNPRRVDLGDGEPIPAARRAEFDSVRAYFDRFLGRPAPAAEVD